MVRKVEIPETIEELEESMSSQEQEPVCDDLRAELIKLSESGEIPNSVESLKKTSIRNLRKIHIKAAKKRTDAANGFLADLLISKFADLLGGIDAVESPQKLADDLERDKLLRADVVRVVESMSPYIPFIGLLSGGVTTASHIYKHKTSGSNENVLNNHEVGVREVQRNGENQQGAC